MKKLFLSLMLCGLVLSPLPALAAPNDLVENACNRAGARNSEVCQEQKLFGPNSIWTNVINTLIFVVGAAATIMIVIGGLRYVLSGGDSAGTKSAKETIIYACVGLVISLMAYGIVNFILSRF